MRKKVGAVINLSDRDEHALKNHLAILLGYAELLVQEAASGDPRREDFEEMHKAALAAIRLLSREREQP